MNKYIEHSQGSNLLCYCVVVLLSSFVCKNSPLQLFCVRSVLNFAYRIDYKIHLAVCVVNTPSIIETTHREFDMLRPTLNVIHMLAATLEQYLSDYAGRLCSSVDYQRCCRNTWNVRKISYARASTANDDEMKWKMCVRIASYRKSQKEKRW